MVCQYEKIPCVWRWGKDSTRRWRFPGIGNRNACDYGVSGPIHLSVDQPTGLPGKHEGCSNGRGFQLHIRADSGGADFALYRGRERGNSMPILAVAAEQLSPQALRRLENEYSLATELDATWAARPLALTRHQRRTALILRDPGGELLDRMIEQHKGKQIDLTLFLRIAIGLAATVGQAHRQGLIHKDVKPENVIVDDAGHVWLTGFGIASRLPRERQAPAPPESIARTLAYMAAEQTGRMNRSVDTRSDLYSLGVTLYQMLTGALPFAAADPLEWVHCHIARQPIAPVDRCTVPEPLSAIIMKLLAKNAEERYQTAAGLEADLRRCLTEWQSDGRIDPFTLGADDSSDQFGHGRVWRWSFVDQVALAAAHFTSLISSDG
jgi:serine/threonine protein kinase